MDQGAIGMAVDLKKAFHTVDHEIFLIVNALQTKMVK